MAADKVVGICSEADCMAADSCTFAVAGADDRHDWVDADQKHCTVPVQNTAQLSVGSLFFYPPDLPVLFVFFSYSNTRQASTAQ